MTRRPCVGVFPIGGADWMGGRNILRYILIAPGSLPDTERPEVVMLATGDLEPDLACLADRVVQVDWGSRAPLQRLTGRLQKEPHISRFLRSEGIDAVFCQQPLGDGSRIPVLTYIPDLQHFRLPDMFSTEEVERRNEQFRYVAARSARVILTSRAALNDFSEFAPDFASRGAFLPVVAPAVPVSHDSAQVCRKYHLPARYYYLPNQFWRHKNHLLVIEAIGLLAADIPDLTVICTGYPYDARHPEYLSELMSEIAIRGVHDQVRILGMVPREDVQPLMRQSLAVLQPSLFEGWSATVEEARSLGKHLILSDIPIFREKEIRSAAFFDPHSAEALAAVLRAGWGSLVAGPDADLEEAARADLDERQLASGRRFVEILRDCMAA